LTRRTGRSNVRNRAGSSRCAKSAAPLHSERRCCTQSGHAGKSSGRTSGGPSAACRTKRARCASVTSPIISRWRELLFVALLSRGLVQPPRRVKNPEGRGLDERQGSDTLWVIEGVVERDHCPIGPRYEIDRAFRLHPVDGCRQCTALERDRVVRGQRPVVETTLHGQELWAPDPARRAEHVLVRQASNRGQQNQSTVPSVVTNAAVCRSPIRPCSPIGG